MFYFSKVNGGRRLIFGKAAVLQLKCLRARIQVDTGQELMRICETPHFKFAKECFSTGGSDVPDVYLSYVERFYPDDVSCTLRNKLDLFKSYVSVGKKLLERSPILVFPRKKCSDSDGEYVIIDGVHRASLQLASGLQSIPVIVVFKIF